MLAKFGEINALAAPASGYQALVCIYLQGGNDGHNTIIPIATAQQSYSRYATVRQGLALPQASLLDVMNGSDLYGFHSSLPELQALYNQGKAAVLANVGNLVAPTNRSIYQSNNLSMLPAALFSHTDQTTQWQSAIPTSIASSGWGGRIADYMQPQNSSAVFPPVSVMAGNGLFCYGEKTAPATVPPPNGSGATGMAEVTGVMYAPSTATGMQQLLSFDNGLQLVQASNGILTRGSTYANTLNGLLTSSNITTPFPKSNMLAAQLLTVANVMSVRGELGLTRQIFFCQLPGFDTHGLQKETQQTLLQQLSQAVAAFYEATQELGLAQDVTTFTISEFGRTLTASGSDGSDHAWGNHHFILGGGVKGGQFYGQFPTLAVGTSIDANNRGTFIPTTAIAQYGGTLAEWFGVPAAGLPSIFPNIGKFSTSNLRFLG
jgi:uncharacterized protein (DUF1501 family)